MVDVKTPPPVPLDQAWPHRRGLMENLINKAFSGPIKALEVGVWFGAGSTQIWMNNLKPGSSLLLLDSWTPFASKEDMEDANWDYQGMDNMTTEAFLGAFLNVMKFEREKKDSHVSIQMTRADLQIYMPLLKDGAFDFIYIDADHKYEKAKSCIHEAKRLVNKKYGVICGDDLEALPTPELVEIATKNKTRDYVRGDVRFHPGVLLSIAEEFKTVNMVNGFWWIVCKDGEFTTSVLKPESLA